MNLGGPEWIIILVVVLVLFGVGRVSRLGGELGSAIREFRKGLSGDEDNGQNTPKALNEGSAESVSANQRERQEAEKS